MDFVIDFVYVGDGDAIIIWARGSEKDFVFFVDGGNTGNGQTVINHFEKNIAPHLQATYQLGFINSHPHADHINGLIEIVQILGAKLSFAVYNDPVECITQELKDKIYASYKKNEDPDITHLYETFEEVEKLNQLCKKFNIARVNAYTEDVNWFNGAIKLLSPSKDFYVSLVQKFTDVDFLKQLDYSQKSAAEVNELEEGQKPCLVVDEVNEQTPENLSSTIIQLTDSKSRKYLLTSDAGVDSFDFAESEGHDLSNVHFAQLPHHGSRRNVSSKWLHKLSPDYYFASAIGNKKHPRRAVINCIKNKVEKQSKVYSTHTSKGVLSYSTNKDVFPVRGWVTATPL